MRHPFFTIGHSTRTLDEFVALLKASDVECVVDVRSFPRSRTNPQFNTDTLPDALAAHAIGYCHLRELGGRRGKPRGSERSANGYWTHPAFRNYADYACTAPFAEGLAALLELGADKRCAIMCSEAVWWRCHRRIITDYLLSRGEEVKHILGDRHVEAASMTPSAHPLPDGTIVYPA